MSKFTETLQKEKSTINVIGILVILAVGILAGVLFRSGELSWGLVSLFGAGFIGMTIAWINRPKGA